MTLERFNTLPYADAVAALLDVCASPGWAAATAAARPFASLAQLRERARRVWDEAAEGDWLAAFADHPRIGDLAALRRKFGHAAREQGQVAAADEAVLERLRAGNVAYEVKFGFIFIVCATGKSAEYMLDLLQTRLSNSREQELRIAAAEQGEIIQVRLAQWSDGGTVL